jgi:aspartyl-tRNA(Asn)/glutamyl-tRNA(Gln) amidotransferase subunit A
VEADIPALTVLGITSPGSLNVRIERMLSAEWSFSQVSAAVRLRKHVQDNVAAVFERVDLLLTPTVPIVAFDIGPDPAATIPVDSNGAAVNLSWFTSPFNLTGNPASSLPCGWTEEGLPIGLQIVGRRMEDGLVLSASRAFEDAQPWTDRWPRS